MRNKIIILIVLFGCNFQIVKSQVFPATNVLERTIGKENSKNFILELQKDSSKLENYTLKRENNKIIVKANSEVALCRGAYDYLKNNCNSMITWSGSNINIPAQLPDVDKKNETPYQFRYYFNVVTHGYTTAYWDWNRWEKEIDWMALHGLNMPLIPGAHEAILYRVFQKLGLTKDEINTYFSGPAYFPWNRMGNLNGWDGPVPDSYFPKQIKLAHKMLDRMKELGMTPIIHAFAGFVPKGINRIYPDIEIRELSWGGGLPEENNAYILSPKSKYFIEIGKLYIQEWEKEFGKADYYLADSFNEMDVPISEDSTQALVELAGYGESVYNSIKEANPNATWVMQGWTFPFHKVNGKLFWTKERLNALVSKVPDDKLLILDLANEYNKVFWKIDPSWKIYDGFFGKKWIYSFIPNMGGKTPWNGILDVYATAPIEALNYENKKNLVGFGFAPEGIENNEVVYELLSDMGWRNNKIDLNDWIGKYCTQRYGAFPDKMKEAWSLLNNSCYGTFTDHPRYRYQFRPYKDSGNDEDYFKTTVLKSKVFAEAVGAFLSCSSEFRKSDLYTYDAIELITQYLGLVADKKLVAFIDTNEKGNPTDISEAINILLTIDSLSASQPNLSLQRWCNFARGWGDNEKEKNYYEANAKRLLTTWGGNPVNDYSARAWSGLIRDYYVQRWKIFYADKMSKDQLYRWEEKWITTPGVSKSTLCKDPLSVSLRMYEKYKNELN